MARNRADRCPGALRPWPADDGLLVRLRLVGGRLSLSSLRALVDVAEEYGDGRVHPTSRANLQLRGLPGGDGRLRTEVLEAIERTGLLPSRTHELVRNIMVSPRTGAAGRADLRPAAASLDDRLCSDPRLAALPGRFLFVLDDGTGDVRERECDLGLVALDATSAQLRVGTAWGSVVHLSDAATRLTDLALEFLDRRGTGATAAWHVAELSAPLESGREPDHRLPEPAPPPPYGVDHVAVPEPGIDRTLLSGLPVTASSAVVVTPWRGLYLPDLAPQETR